MIITRQPLCNLLAEAQENKIVCQLKNEMKLVLTTKLSRYKDLYETNFMLKELTEMIKILQFRCYFKFRMSLQKLIPKN